MIVPADVDFDTATEQEVIDAYEAMGMDADYGRFVFRLHRGDYKGIIDRVE